jgi:hypothetical protein
MTRVARLRDAVEVAWVGSGGESRAELKAAEQREELIAQKHRDEAASSGTNQERQQRSRSSRKRSI